MPAASYINTHIAWPIVKKPFADNNTLAILMYRRWSRKQRTSGTDVGAKVYFSRRMCFLKNDARPD